jgi:hypothetical protein|tara:strand:+ start:1469 stop:1741 length:273 start_codon:yes stop_codon:yes gene_type:complete
MAPWKKMKPHSKKQRQTMKKKYGNKCFIEPKNLKLPICNKKNGEIQCKGLRAAQYYTQIHVSKKLKPRKKYLTRLKKIKKLTKKYCKNKV